MLQVRCRFRGQMRRGAGSVVLVYAVAGAVACLDQLSKFLVKGCLALGEARPVIGGIFNLTLIRNDGAAFGMLRGNNSLFIALTLVAVVIVVALRGRYRAASPVVKIAVGLILGGAVGNLVDRLLLGHVIDFLDFHIGSCHWPAFNLADSSICIGAALLILFSAGRKAK